MSSRYSECVVLWHWVLLATSEDIAGARGDFSSKSLSPFSFSKGTISHKCAVFKHQQLRGTCIRVLSTITVCCFQLQCSDTWIYIMAVDSYFRNKKQTLNNHDQQHGPTYSSTSLLYLEKRHEGGVFIEPTRFSNHTKCKQIANDCNTKIPPIFIYKAHWRLTYGKNIPWRFVHHSYTTLTDDSLCCLFCKNKNKFSCFRLKKPVSDL